MTGKYGLVVTTYNSEDWFKQLHESIPFTRLDECIIVNGGDKYTGVYNKHTAWINHLYNVHSHQSRIDGIQVLIGRGCEHIFIIEDDMIIKDIDIFQRYVSASKETGLKYLCFCSNANGNGEPFERTPKQKIEYNNNIINFYGEMNNEFTYHHASVFEEIGMYDTSFHHLWDVDHVYRVLTSERFGCGFRYFPDVHDSDRYIMNNPESINNSRINTDNNRDNELSKYFQRFHDKHDHHIPTIPIWSIEKFKSKLKQLYNNR
tara:strand:- start:1385 stop:2167 length:783 start_codon:yes stop_codon:yes gene_type:complete